MQKMLLRVGNDLTIWIQDNNTYYYSRREHTVYTDDAQTAGFSHWPGKKLFETIRAAGIGTVRYARDPETGHQMAVVRAALMDIKGPKSLILEFDVATKVLLSMRQWPNLDRSGEPDMVSDKIVYFEDLPDKIFTVALPDDVRFRSKEVEVADELLGLLALPQHGMSLPGQSEGAAARTIVAEMWNALIGLDLVRLRQLCPGMALWNDELLRTVLSGVDGQDAVVEVLEIGEAVRRGYSRLGPVMVVPSRVRRRNGKIYEEKMIIQFRPAEGAASCVVYSGYGVPYQLE